MSGFYSHLRCSSKLLLSLWLTVLGTATSAPLQAAPMVSREQPIIAEAHQQRSRARQLQQQALQQQRLGTATSIPKAIVYYQEALKIWEALGDLRQQANTLNSVGTAYYTLSQHQQALQAFERGLAVARQTRDQSTIAYLLASVGNAHYSLDQVDVALQYYQQALEQLQGLNQPGFKAVVLTTTGNAYTKLGRTSAAIATYQQARQLYQASEDTDGEASVLRLLGNLHQTTGQTRQAEAVLKSALDIYRQTKNLAEQSSTLAMLGTLYLSQGKAPQAVTILTEALALSDQQPNRPFQLLNRSTLLHGLATAYWLNDDRETALTTFNQALETVRAYGNREFEAHILNDLGVFYDHRGEPHQALQTFQQALRIYQALNLENPQISALLRIGEARLALGEHQKALDIQQQALDKARSIQNPISEANALVEIAEVYQALGTWEQSIDTYQQALVLYRKSGNQTKIATTHQAIGDTYHAQDKYDAALQEYLAARRLVQQQDNSIQELAILSSMVRTYEALENYPQAQQTATLMTGIAAQKGLSTFRTLSQIFTGRIQRAAGDLPAALATFQQAQTDLQAHQFPLADAHLWANLGKTHRMLRQFAPAMANYEAALKIYQQLGQQTDAAVTYYDLALVAQAQTDLAQAQTYIEQAIKIVESLRTNLVSPDLRTAYFQTVQDYYELYIDILMQRQQQSPQQGYDALALNISERSRARSLLDLLTEAHADIRQGVDPDLLEQERQLQAQLNALEKRRINLRSSATSAKQWQTLATERKALLAQSQRLRDIMRRQSPQYAALKYPDPLSLQQIQQQVLDPETVLLQYALGKERSYLWVITQDQMVSHPLPPRAAIDAIAKRARTAILQQSPTRTVTATLSQLLLQPATRQLRRKSRVVIVGDGVLQYLPFAALPSPSQAQAPLLATHEVVNLPSSSTLGLLRQQQLKPLDPKKGNLTIFADPVFGHDDLRASHLRSVPPPQRSLNQIALNQTTRQAKLQNWQRLPGTRQEAEAILALLPHQRSTSAFGFDASRHRVLNHPQIRRSQILHFATHGLLNSRHPELSGLIFSLVDAQGRPQNGFLRLHDVFNLELTADLVVLSACQTGLGQVVRGEGLVGLTRGFMYAGVPRLVVSLWDVDDAATAELMTRFYHHLLTQQLTPAAALRQAQLDLQQNPQWRDPFYWAAFTLQGEWQ